MQIVDMFVSTAHIYEINSTRFGVNLHFKFRSTEIPNSDVDMRIRVKILLSRNPGDFVGPKVLSKVHKTNLNDLIAAVDIVILQKLHSNNRLFPV